MKVVAAVVYICMAFILVGSGCSNEEQPVYPENSPRVKLPINRPAPERPEGVPAQEEAKRAPEPAPVKKESVDVKISAVKEKAPIVAQEAVKQGAQEKKEEKGIYVTGKGDSLSRIAGRDDVYGDPLKWTILYRLNRDKLRDLKSDTDLPDRELTGGIGLKVITPDEARVNLEKRKQDIWVVNVLSSPEREKIVPRAVKLMDNGARVYITRVKVKGKDWMRLRVGFFKKRKIAETEGKKLIAILKLSDIWTTKIGEKEFEKFGGY